MPAYQLHIYEQQEEREALEQKICEQVDACTEVNGKIRNRVKKFLIEEGITDISEMDVASSDERRDADTGRAKKLYHRVS